MRRKRGFLLGRHHCMPFLTLWKRPCFPFCQWDIEMSHWSFHVPGECKNESEQVSHSISIFEAIKCWNENSIPSSIPTSQLSMTNATNGIFFLFIYLIYEYFWQAFLNNVCPRPSLQSNQSYLHSHHCIPFPT